MLGIHEVLSSSSSSEDITGEIDRKMRYRRGDGSQRTQLWEARETKPSGDLDCWLDISVEA